MPVKLGVIGCGVIGRKHLEAARDDEHIDVVAVADLDPDARESAKREYDVPKAYDSAEALIADGEIDAVVCALITGVRGKVAVAAAKAGKHVLLEKPPAMSADELAAIGDAADASGVTLGCCSARMTFNAVAEEGRRVVDSGVLGPIRTIHVRCVKPVQASNPDHTPPKWRVRHDLNGGGYLVNWGVYDLDFMLYVLGDAFEPDATLAQMWPVAPHLATGRVDPASDAECHVVALVRGRGGETLFLERGEFTSLPASMRWQIAGERGAMTLQMLAGKDQPTLVLHRAEAQQGLIDEVVLEDFGEDVQHPMPVRDFAQAIREQRPPRTSFDRAMRLQRILDAIYGSARAGG